MPDSASAAVPGSPSDLAALPVALSCAVTTFAGSGTAGFADGTAATAQFNGAAGVALDATGNLIVGDDFNNRIRKLTPAGVVTTLAGSGTLGYQDGTGAGASFKLPEGVGLDSAGNVFVADQSNNRIRKVTAGGVVTTLAGSGTGSFADGTGVAASFKLPVSVAVDPMGNIFVSDGGNNRIRKVTSAGLVTTHAGSGTAAFADGTGVAASFSGPYGLALDSAGALFVADQSNHRIRKITAAGVVTTLAGSGTATFADGTGAAASFSFPAGVAVDAAGTVYVSDGGNHRIRRVTSSGVVTTLAGTGTATFGDGACATASFRNPGGLLIDAGGSLYVADGGNNRIRKVNPTTGRGELVVTWSAPTSMGSSAISSYLASAVAAGQPMRTCTTTAATTCTISGLTSGVAYSTSVTATNAAGTSPVSTPTTATPN